MVHVGLSKNPRYQSISNCFSRRYLFFLLSLLQVLASHLHQAIHIVFSLWAVSLQPQALYLFFPTCQVRVAIDFIRTASLPPPPPPPSPSSPRQSTSPSVSPILFAKCLANPLRQVSHQSCSPSFSPILFASWGSQWALLALNRHRPLAVSAAGPQPWNRMPKYLTDKVSDKMVEHMSGYMPNRMSKYMPKSMPEYMSGRMPENISSKVPHGPNRMPDGMSEYMRDNMSAGGDHSKKVILQTGSCL